MKIEVKCNGISAVYDFDDQEKVYDLVRRSGKLNPRLVQEIWVDNELFTRYVGERCYVF